jgi:uncharacterized protein with ParB-like and HNH nuclease domain
MRRAVTLFYFCRNYFIHARGLLYKRVQERIGKSLVKFEEVLIELEECIRDKVVSILISVVDEANSYLIFETLNDRGLDLSVADLLKNYFFSRASDKIKEVQKNGQKLIF